MPDLEDAMYETAAMNLGVLANSSHVGPVLTISGPDDVMLFHDYILIQLLPRLQTLKGIVLPDTAERQVAALVVAVGPGRVSEYGFCPPIPVQVEDIIFLKTEPMYQPELLELDDRSRKFLIIRSRDLQSGVKRNSPVYENYMELLRQQEREDRALKLKTAAQDAKLFSGVA